MHKRRVVEQKLALVFFPRWIFLGVRIVLVFHSKLEGCPQLCHIDSKGPKNIDESSIT
jgi:hypothetical protein